MIVLERRVFFLRKNYSLYVGFVYIQGRDYTFSSEQNMENRDP